MSRDIDKSGVDTHSLHPTVVFNLQYLCPVKRLCSTQPDPLFPQFSFQFFLTCVGASVVLFTNLLDSTFSARSPVVSICSFRVFDSIVGHTVVLLYLLRSCHHDVDVMPPPIFKVTVTKNIT